MKDGERKTNPFTWERMLPAGGIQKWLRKVMPFEWSLGLGEQRQEEASGAG